MASLPPDTVRDALIEAVSLCTQYDPSLLGVPRSGLRLSTSVTAHPAARPAVGFQFSIEREGTWIDEAASEGPLPLGIVAPGPDLAPRERRRYRARIATSDGWSDWSSPVEVEGELPATEWGARVIGRDHPVDGPAPMLRKEFELTAIPQRARLYSSFLGIGDVWINGQRATDEHLAPGWTSYGQRVLVATHDVASLLVAGTNVVVVQVTDGWYRGNFGPARRERMYGERTGAILRLEADDVALVTDGTWLAGFGAVRAASLYDGTEIDLTRPSAATASLSDFTDESFVPVDVIETPLNVFEPRIAPPVRTIEVIEPALRTSGDSTRLDVGQNISGWLRLRVRGKAGARVVLTHAEILDPENGELYTKSLRSAKATDQFILADDGEALLEPVFTFHGFRFAEVVGAEVLSAEAIVISSDLAVRSSFESDQPALNRFHENVVWSQRDNFVSVPTDCPQRDERLGWTGDAQAFAAAGSTLFDAEMFWASWLRDLELDQTDSEGVPAIVPNIMEPDEVRIDGEVVSLIGRAGWADAATIVPVAVYDAYGSDEVLVRQRSSIRRWVDHLRRRAGADIVLPRDGFQFSDWLDPDAPGDRPWLAKVDEDFVTDAFYVRSTRLAARVERLVGDHQLADDYDRLADVVAAETWRRWGATAYRTQTGAAIALEFEIAPADERERIGDWLASNVREQNGRIATGFLGTPLVLFALSSTGHYAEAFMMLLRRDAPSWLYQVAHGATTVWERWDAIRADGSIHAGELAVDGGNESGDEGGSSMLSFNHYAYGAMIDWVYREVAGIAPLEPGYRVVRIAPHPSEQLREARADVNTRFGRVAIEWTLRGDDLHLTVDIPYGSQGVLDLPVGADSVVTVNGGAAGSVLAHGHHEITVSHASVVSGAGV